MKTVIQEGRLAAGLTLRELSKGLGPGFSPARLSLAERNLIQIPAHEERAIMEAIDRLGPLCANRRRIVEIAKDLDLRPFVREAHCAA
jgi:hypothetical protein